jgi:hypothetical protein
MPGIFKAPFERLQEAKYDVSKLSEDDLRELAKEALSDYVRAGSGEKALLFTSEIARRSSDELAVINVRLAKRVTTLTWVATFLAAVQVAIALFCR